MSFRFNNSSSAQNFMLLFSVVWSGAFLIVTIVMSFFPDVRTALFYIRFGLRIVPSYAFGETLVNIMLKDSTMVHTNPLGVWDMEVGQYAEMQKRETWAVSSAEIP